MLADSSADPEVVAADLLAQSEHDISAVPILVSLDEGLVSRVEEQLHAQLERLSTAPVARVALNKNGFAVIAESIEEAVYVCNQLAPEHLEIHTAQPEAIAGKSEPFPRTLDSHSFRQGAELWCTLHRPQCRRSAWRLRRWTQPYSSNWGDCQIIRRVVCAHLHESEELA